MKKINVLGTGPSLQLFKENENLTVGLNKIVMTHYVDHLVIADVPETFPKFIHEQIKKSPFGEFHTFTQLQDKWRPYINTKMNIFELMPARGEINLNDPRMPQSVSGGFIAAALAQKLGGTIIDLYGIDYVGHFTFNNPVNKDMLKQIKRDFLLLQKKFNEIGVCMRVTPGGLLSDHFPLIPL